MFKVVIVLLVVTVMLVGIVGCQTGVTVTTDSSLFYPDCKTKAGGSFGDPGGRGHGFDLNSGSSGTKGIGNYGGGKK